MSLTLLSWNCVSVNYWQFNWPNFEKSVLFPITHLAGIFLAPFLEGLEVQYSLSLLFLEICPFLLLLPVIQMIWLHLFYQPFLGFFNLNDWLLVPESSAKEVMNILGSVPFHLLLSVIITCGPLWIESHCRHASSTRQGSGDFALLSSLCCSNTKELAQLCCSFLWRRWKLEGLIIFYPMFGSRKLRHFSFLALGMDFQPVICSCQPSTHRMCSQQWEVTVTLGIRAICLIWPWVMEAPWCLIKRSPLLQVSSNSAEADRQY